MKCTVDDIKKLGTILGVWAHPDDESWCMGGVMACAAANGQRVVCVTATHGDAGKTADETKWPRARLGEIRELELEKALKVLGVREHYWLDYKDGQLLAVDIDKASDKIAAIIKNIQPDTIFSFGQDGLTGHNDHRTVHEWTRQAIQKSHSDARLYRVVETDEKFNAPITKKGDSAFNIYFNIDKPETVAIKNVDFYFELPDDIHKKKLESLRVQECQTAQMFADPLGLEYLQETAKSEAFMNEPT